MKKERNMHEELEILKLADYHETFTYGGCKAELILNRKMADHPCLFGFTELSESADEVRALFSAMEARAASLGYHELVGPVNYCSWMTYRWAISRFDLHLFPDCDNPPYYPELLKQAGYRELYTYRSASIDMHNPVYEMGEVLYRQKCSEGFVFRLYEGDAVYEMADTVFDISCEAFRGSHLYCDIPRSAFHALYLQWTRGLKIAMCIAEYQGKPVGYVMGYDSPDGNCFISKTSAVLPEFRKHKIYTALMYVGWQYVMQKGYSDMMYHFQCEQKETFRRFDSELESNEKRYAVFIKEF